MYYLSPDIHLYNGLALVFLFTFQMTRALTPRTGGFTVNSSTVQCNITVALTILTYCDIWIQFCSLVPLTSFFVACWWLGMALPLTIRMCGERS